jgi:aspartokinase-like uncharacterized kinase
VSPLVVKIGGSLWRSPLLAEWIAALRAYPGPLTLVPGGGPFADVVRAAQGEMGFGDAAAHEMALLAMEQYGLALASAFPGLTPVRTPDEAERAHAQGAIAVWRPTVMAHAAGVPANWDVTSDSLAAWYAKAVGVSQLLVVKSVDWDERLDWRRLVDPYFPVFAQDLDVSFCGPLDVEAAQTLLAQGDLPGRRVDVTT